MKAECIQALVECGIQAQSAFKHTTSELFVFKLLHCLKYNLNCHWLGCPITVICCLIDWILCILVRFMTSVCRQQSCSSTLSWFCPGDGGPRTEAPSPSPDRTRTGYPFPLSSFPLTEQDQDRVPPSTSPGTRNAMDRICSGRYASGGHAGRLFLNV